MVIDLQHQLAGQVFPFMLVFTRMAAGLMMFPGIGEAFVPQRIRMLFALVFTFLLLPVLGPQMPPMPPHIPNLVVLLATESIIGLFFGTILRLLMDIVETTGSIIALETGLSNAMVMNPAMAGQSALTSAFLGIAAIVLLFLTGLDHLLLRALVGTYAIFPVGADLPVGDMTESFIAVMARCFTVGVQLASPFIVIALLLYVALGIMQRLMPQIQLFLIILPAQIWGGFFVFFTTLAVILTVWLQVFDEIAAKMFIR